MSQYPSVIDGRQEPKVASLKQRPHTVPGHVPAISPTDEGLRLPVILQVAGEQEAAVVMVRIREVQTRAFEAGNSVRQVVADGILEVIPQPARIPHGAMKRAKMKRPRKRRLEAKTAICSKLIYQCRWLGR